MSAKWEYRVRAKDGSVYLMFGDHRQGEHYQFDFYGDDELAAKFCLAMNSHQALVDAVRYADARAISRAAYPHSCAEDQKLRDLIDVALASLDAKP